MATSDTPLLQRQTEDDAGPQDPVLVEPDASPADGGFELPETRPHAVLGVTPTHGPFIGGQLATIRGNGFGTNVRVWVGGNEVPAAETLAIDPQRVQVTIPPGNAGAADIVTQNGDDTSTQSSLTDGYVYDRYYAQPPSGPTSGGTVLTLFGQGTSWDSATEVFIDLKPCENVEVLSQTQLSCTAPPGTPGSKPLRVVSSDGVVDDVLDGWIYGDSDNGFKGGLSGNALGESLKVLVLDNFSGSALPFASVIVGESLEQGLVNQTDGAGVAQFSGELGPKTTVTVAAHCYQPTTFVDVPVDRVTVYLDPVLSVACAGEGVGELPKPSTGGNPANSANLAGELVWSGGVEFQRAGWTNVPVPKGENEELAAYVFRPTSDPTRDFRLPDAATKITTESPGGRGYSFDISTSGGNLTLYALAGIENRNVSPPLFTAFAMGLVSGVSADPGETVSDIFIAMDNPLDHALSLEVTGPQPTSKGPDRVRTSTALRLSSGSYALLPVGSRTELLPLAAPIELVGLPPLVGSLAGTQYVSTARAFTGQNDTAPRSVIGLFATTASNQTVVLDDFVEVPQLKYPNAEEGNWDGTRVELDWAPGGANVDLTVVEIQSGDALVSWVIAVPNGRKDVRLPDLDQLGLGLKRGVLTLSVSTANIESFDYGSLRYRDLRSAAWSAYATDVFGASY